MNGRIVLILICSVSWFVTSCTRNPFFDDTTQTKDGSTLTGHIQINDGSPASGAYVWLKGFNLGLYADESGQFKLTLPNPDVQPGGGLSGEFTLYYYMGNCAIDSSKILLLRGAIKYGNADVDETGKITRTIVLQKLLDMQMTLSPTSYSVSDTLYFEIEIALANLVDPLLVQTVFSDYVVNMLGLVYFKEIHASAKDAVKHRSGSITRVRVRGLMKDYYFRLKTNALNLPPGQYEVVPYFEVLQYNIPNALLESLGVDMLVPDYHYLNVPYARSKIVLTVRE